MSSKLGMYVFMVVIAVVGYSLGRYHQSLSDRRQASTTVTPGYDVLGKQLSALGNEIGELKELVSDRSARQGPVATAHPPARSEEAGAHATDEEGVYRELKDIKTELQRLSATSRMGGAVQIRSHVSMMENELGEIPDTANEQQQQNFTSLKARIYDPAFRKQLAAGEYMNTDEYKDLTPKQLMILDAHIAYVLSLKETEQIKAMK